MTLINKLAWVGTACGLCTPYLLPTKLGFIMGALACVFLSPPCVINRQWNLITLNSIMFTGYLLKILNII